MNSVQREEGIYITILTTQCVPMSTQAPGRKLITYWQIDIRPQEFDPSNTGGANFSSRGPGLQLGKLIFLDDADPFNIFFKRVKIYHLIGITTP